MPSGPVAVLRDAGRHEPDGRVAPGPAREPEQTLAGYSSAPGPIAVVPSESTGEIRPNTLPSGSIR